MRASRSVRRTTRYFLPAYSDGAMPPLQLGPMERARLSVSVVFLMHGAVAGSWLARIPAVQEHLGLGEAALGLALLGSGLGSLVAMLPAGALIGRYGSRGMVAVTVIPWSIS